MPLARRRWQLGESLESRPTNNYSCIHMAAKQAASNERVLRRNEEKWTAPLMDAGWTAIPSIILDKQHALGLDPVDDEFRGWLMPGYSARCALRSETRRADIQLLRIRWLNQGRDTVRSGSVEHPRRARAEDVARRSRKKPKLIVNNTDNGKTTKRR